MHLLLHVIGAQVDSGYKEYFPIGVFFVVLGFHIFFFIQRVLGPLLQPAGTAAAAVGAPGGGCCATAVPAHLNKASRFSLLLHFSEFGYRASLGYRHSSRSNLSEFGYRA